MQTIFVQVKCELGEAYSVADKAVETWNRCRRFTPPPVSMIC